MAIRDPSRAARSDARTAAQLATGIAVAELLGHAVAVRGNGRR